jgi:DNA-directed RNA polymerase specialized sigma24 family protein
VTFDEGRIAAGRGLPPVDVLALHQALERLEMIDARKVRVVELRFFGGLNVEETAHALDISRRRSRATGAPRRSGCVARWERQAEA